MKNKNLNEAYKLTKRLNRKKHTVFIFEFLNGISSSSSLSNLTKRVIDYSVNH